MNESQEEELWRLRSVEIDLQAERNHNDNLIAQELTLRQKLQIAEAELEKYRKRYDEEASIRKTAEKEKQKALDQLAAMKNKALKLAQELERMRMNEYMLDNYNFEVADVRIPREYKGRNWRLSR